MTHLLFTLRLLHLLLCLLLGLLLLHHPFQMWG
jgi:hypothetical protein